MAAVDSSRYREAAMGTLAYVKQKLTFGASNKLDFYTKAAKMELTSSIRGLGMAWGALGLGSHLGVQRGILRESERVGQEAQAAGQPYIKGTQRFKRAQIEIFARQGLQYRAGNCGVQSAVAFVRLRDHWKVFPLDWVQLKNGDHGFVVVGRDGETDVSDPATWNDEAVICDPWRGVVQTARAYSGSSREVLELLYRRQSASDRD